MSSSDSDEENTRNYYKWKHSSCCLKFADIKNFIVGATTSTFWKYKSHLNYSCTREYNYIDNMPFFSWQCITI